ncbi:MAG: hypothetical protein GXW85_03255 [Clostridia bacterium]|nr:hypothetical protein [Clostridia bacterium]
MGPFMSVAIWFTGLAVITKLLLPDGPLGYFWFVLFFLSLFFGLANNNGKKLAPEDFDYQQNIWWVKYQGCSYEQREQFLSEMVNKAVKTKQVEKAEQFLKAVIDHEPDNELAKSLLIGIWGSEVINKSG